MTGGEGRRVIACLAGRKASAAIRKDKIASLLKGVVDDGNKSKIRKR